MGIVDDKEFKETVFQFLDNLRESGVTNMFGAGPYIRSAYPVVTRAEARALLTEWMETFDERHPREDEE